MGKLSSIISEHSFLFLHLQVLHSLEGRSRHSAKKSFDRMISVCRLLLLLNDFYVLLWFLNAVRFEIRLYRAPILVLFYISYAHYTINVMN